MLYAEIEKIVIRTRVNSGLFVINVLTTDESVNFSLGASDMTMRSLQFR